MDMKQNLFKSVAVAMMLVAVATLASTKNAKADIIGIGLGYEFESNLIAFDVLVPLKHHGAKRPQGSVLNFGLRIRGGNNERTGMYSYSSEWIDLAVPVAYEYVFDSGISIVAGAEFRYVDEKEKVSSTGTVYPKNNVVDDMRLGGGIVLGSDYFFKSGVFLGLRIAAGALFYEWAYEEGGRREGVYGYAAPTLSVGYMF